MLKELRKLHRTGAIELSDSKKMTREENHYVLRCLMLPKKRRCASMVTGVSMVGNSGGTFKK